MFSDLAYLNQALLLALCFGVVLHRLRLHALVEAQTEAHFARTPMTAATTTSPSSSASWLRRRMARFDLRTLAIVMLLLSIVIMLVYDVVMATVKYMEGYYVDVVTGLIITRPLDKYVSGNRKLVRTVDVLQNMAMTLQASAVLLLMALWNHMAKSLINKPFMSSREFKAYAAYSLLSLAIYPFLQVAYFLSGNVLIASVVPLFIYCFQCIVLLALTQVTNIRFRRLLSQMPLLSDAKLRITYYVRMNNYLALALLLTISGLLPLAIDIVTADTLAFNKLLLDVAGELFTIGFVMAVFVGVLILVPSVDRMPINSTGNSSSMSAHPAATPTRPGAAVAAVVLRQPPFARGNVPPAIQTTGMEPPKPQNIVRQGRGANSPLGRVHSVVSSVDGGEANNDRRTTSVHRSQSAIKSGGSRQGSPQLKRSPEGFYSVEQAV